jgi:hypothetical protein
MNLNHFPSYKIPAVIAVVLAMFMGAEFYRVRTFGCFGDVYSSIRHIRNGSPDRVLNSGVSLKGNDLS